MSAWTSRSSRFPPVLLRREWWKCQLPDSKGPPWGIILCRLTGPDTGWLWSAFLRPGAASEHNRAPSMTGLQRAGAGSRQTGRERWCSAALVHSDLGWSWTSALEAPVAGAAAAERAAPSCREQSCRTLLNVSAGDCFDLLKSDCSIFSRRHDSQASLRFASSGHLFLRLPPPAQVLPIASLFPGFLPA